MFTKTTHALAIIVGLTSGAFAATKQRASDMSNPPAATWQDPTLGMKTWDSYGKRWD